MPAGSPTPAPADLREFVGENVRPRVDRGRLAAAAWAFGWPVFLTSAKPLTVRERRALAGEPADPPPAPVAPAVPAEKSVVEAGPPVPDRPAIAGFGVSLAGAEFGVEDPAFSAANPGVPGGTYTYPSPGSVADVAAAGVRLVRLPVRWERLQPVPGGPLNPDELGRLRLALDALAAESLRAIVDLHNYARFTLGGPRFEGGARSVLIDEVVVGPDGRRDVPVPRDAFAAFWATLVRDLLGHAAVAGWGLMNEPHDLAPHGAEFADGPACDWAAVSRLAAAAVRRVDPHTPVVVGGADWSSSERWRSANGPDAWVDDPHVVYEAHCYFDADASGKYAASFQDEARRDPLLADRGVRRAAPFLEWCARTGSRGFLGEFGVPPAEPGWLDVLTPFLNRLAGSETPGCLWAAGEWWGEYPLNVHPAGGVAGPVLGAALAAGRPAPPGAGAG